MMIVTEWLSPEYGLTVNVKQLTWKTEEVDTHAALSKDTEGSLLVVTAEDVRVEWSPITYADFSALESVIDQPSFGNVYEGLTEEANRRDDTDEDEQTVEDILDQLERIDDIMPDDEDKIPSPSERDYPWEDDPRPQDNEPDRWGPYWSVTKTTDETTYYEVEQKGVNTGSDEDLLSSGTTSSIQISEEDDLRFTNSVVDN